MRKVLLTAAVLGLLIGSASLSSQAVTTAVERGYISVNTTANTELAPDVAEVSIAVQTTDAKSMQKAYNFLKIFLKSFQQKLSFGQKSQFDQESIWEWL